MYGWEKVSSWECLFAHSEKRLFLSVYVEWMTQIGWKVLNEEVDLLSLIMCTRDVLKDSMK